MTVQHSPDQAAAAVLRFWFDEVGAERWFARDEALDRAIARRFAGLRNDVVASRAEGWRDDLASLTAAVILVDQFGRNLFRGSARAFADDDLALLLCRRALDRGWTHDAPPPWRQFLLMPLMHSEQLSDQQRSLDEFALLGDQRVLDFARLHHDQIARFGRFPGRNASLGRRSSVAEQAVIDAGAF